MIPPAETSRVCLTKPRAMTGVFILMYALNFSTDAPLWFTERDIAQIRKWWCIMLMERYQIEGHGQRFSYWTNEARELLKGALEPVYRVPKKRKTEHEVQFQKSDMCFILELPNCLLSAILMEMVLQEGDKAYSTLALVCTTFRDTMSTVSFRRGAHFRWLDSVATWSWFSASYKEDFRVMYTIDTCRGCLELYKNCKPGYVGTGKRGELKGIYSDDQHPGYCSHFCNLIS
ncbi:MFS-type transporter [Dissostichus eleginoides]|uniref:MFS-type transporter n=1 Tax=Dissostichus eleginoides TaxID=100907 RepID=A0AAD9ETN3_DISEL|nr:MFS-type transporter [Dissostichus eleginoides]